MPKVENFLQHGVKQVRKGIKDIIESYNNDWDILAELCQNAVDAIKLTDRSDGFIKIIVNSQNKEISITDNGIGIKPERLPELLAPFHTDKEDDENLIGEKGVGLTFVLFSCNDFYIKSGSSHGVAEGNVKDALLWSDRSTSEQLPLDYNILKEEFEGTYVHIKKVYDNPIFDLNFEQIKFLLRTRTALGNTNSIWRKEKPIEISLTVIDQDGNTQSEQLPYKYWLPIEGLESHSISLSDFNEYIKKDRTDQDKRKKLKDKIVFDIGEISHNGGRNIKYFACFVPKRKTWFDISKNFGIITEENSENPDFFEKFHYLTFQSGIFTSVKGMPTGISIEHPPTGAASSWPQVFILFEDRQIKFDIGRKSIHGMQAKIYRNHSRTIFSKLQRLSKYISGELIIETEWDKDDIFAEIDSLIDLNINDIKFQKVPKDQEASVAALFYECIGNGKIKNIQPLISGYRNRYDLYAKWGNKKVVIEFKSKLSGILKDFSDEVKLFNEIDCIVCWNIDENDKQQFSEKGIDIQEISESSLPGIKPRVFPNATHELLLSGFTSPIYAIDMKRVINFRV